MRLAGQRNQCPTCGMYFTSTHAFDNHRTGTYTPQRRRCLSVDEMHDARMAPNAAGFWRIEPTDAQRDRFAAMNASRSRVYTPPRDSLASGDTNPHPTPKNA